MKLTPRKQEVDAIAELLESDQYESAQALAKDVIKRVCELLDERDFVAWVWRESPDAFQLGFGPFSSEAEASRHVKKIGAALRGQHMLLPLAPTADLVRRFDEKPTSNAKCSCGHSEVVHQHPGFSGRCVARGCRCRKFATVV